MNRPVLLLTHGAAEMSWLSACLAYATLALVGRAIPFEYSLGLFGMAAVIGHLSLGRGLRNGIVVIIQLVSFAAAMAVPLRLVNDPTSPLFSSDWIVEGLHGTHTLRYWVDLFVLSFAALLYWAGGVFFALRQVVYRSACTRFDIGLASFFTLFLIEMVVAIKGGSPVAGTGTLYSLFSFLLFGLLSIGITRATPSGSRDYLPGYGVVGVVATFSAAIVLCVGSIVLFFLPALQQAAEVSYAALATGGRLLGSLILPILRFTFGPRNVRPEPASPHIDLGSLNYAHPTTWYGRLIEDVMIWGSKGVAILMILFAAGLIVFFLTRWLLNRSGRPEIEKTEENGRNLFSRLWSALVLLLYAVAQAFRGYESARDLYKALRTWGRRSGLPPLPAETPSEFGRRLAYYYPQLESSVDRIIDALNREAYGRTRVAESDFSRARSGLRSLSHPRHWPRRLKTILVQQEGRR